MTIIKDILDGNNEIYLYSFNHDDYKQHIMFNFVDNCFLFFYGDSIVHETINGEFTMSDNNITLKFDKEKNNIIRERYISYNIIEENVEHQNRKSKYTVIFDKNPIYDKISMYKDYENIYFPTKFYIF